MPVNDYPEINFSMIANPLTSNPPNSPFLFHYCVAKACGILAKCDMLSSLTCHA